MNFRILGPLEVVDRGRALQLGGARQRALLALLLTRANQVVSADRLIDELWGAQPPRTAVNALQYHVSQLRRALAPCEAIVTRAPGYVIRVDADELDLLRFELLVEAAHDAPPQVAERQLREALALWRGQPLADLADTSFARSEALRLEELRLMALERRFDADLALGRFADIVGEIQLVVREHPFRERPRAALMRALYGAGRQAEALEVYRETRRTLVGELGIEPSPALQELEQAMLRHDPALTLDASHAPRLRAIMVVATDPGRFAELLAIADPLARRPARELILSRFLRPTDELPAATAALAEHRDALGRRGVASRIVAYTAHDAGAEAVRLATEHDVDLVLLDGAIGRLEGGRLAEDVAVVLEQAPCDVAALFGSGGNPAGAIVTPFGGIDHDWAAIELAAWLASSLDTTLRLLGTEAGPASERRDASRLLSRASMLVQQVVGIVAEPVLVPIGEAGVLEAARDARLLVVGLSGRWRTEGVGRARMAVALGARAPTLFVKRGLRPGGLAPTDTVTRFSWTIGSESTARS